MFWRQWTNIFTMDSREICNGNYLSYDFEICIVIGIYMEKVILQTSSGNPKIVDLEDDLLSPVPLTKEILSKISKPSSQKSFLDYYFLEIAKSSFYFRPSCHGGFYWGFYDPNDIELYYPSELFDCPPIKFVHNLQNLLYNINKTTLDLHLSPNESIKKELTEYFNINELIKKI